MALVLITGSRVCSPEMAIKVKEVVKWLVDQGHGLIVGDAPGVDQVAIYEMLHLGRSSCVEICSGHARLITFPGDHTSSIFKKGNLFRNRYMVNKCDMVVAIWNGKSIGTHYTIKYAQKKGRHVVLRKFVSQQIHRWARFH